MYTNQSLLVKWKYIYISKSFRCSNGLNKAVCCYQFTIVFTRNELLGRLAVSNVGCYIGKTFMGAISYADVLTLPASSARAAKCLLNIWEEYATEYDVMFNSSKGLVMLYNVQSESTCQFMLNVSVLEQCDKALHPGNYIGNSASPSNTANVNKAVGHLVHRTNVLV